jgi:hypothetical protein
MIGSLFKQRTQNAFFFEDDTIFYKIDLTSFDLL